MTKHKIGLGLLAGITTNNMKNHKIYLYIL